MRVSGPRPNSSWMTTRDADAEPTETALQHMSRLPREPDLMIADYQMAVLLMQTSTISAISHNR
jgi:hypothetical protein